MVDDFDNHLIQKKNEHLMIADFFGGAEKHLIFMLVNLKNFIRSCLEFARLLQKVTTSQWNCNDLSSASLFPLTISHRGLP